VLGASNVLWVSMAGPVSICPLPVPARSVNRYTSAPLCGNRKIEPQARETGPERGTRFGKLLVRSVADAAAAPPRDYYLKGLISPGELSLWWGDGVAARKNGVSIGVSVAQFGDRAARRPQAESLAKLIVKRLPK